MSESNAAEPTSGGGTWGMRYPGLTMQTTGRNTVKEFTGMWPLKHDADLEALQAVAGAGGSGLRLTFRSRRRPHRWGLIRHGALVRRPNAGLRWLRTVLRHTVRRQPGRSTWMTSC